MFNIKVTKTLNSQLTNIDFSNLPFGKTFSDHIFIADFEDGQWTDLRIEPFGPISMHPASSVLHYGQAIFEGMKAYRQNNGELVLFRADEHARRFNESAQRLCMAEVPEKLFIQAVNQLVAIDSGWVPQTEGSSLYIRPFMLATDEFIGVRPSTKYKFIIFTGPVGPYYAKPVTLITSNEYVRAVKGGVGEAKAAGNYAASLLPMKQATEAGYDQVMWLDAKEHKYVQEVGTMNLFFVIGDTVVTPATDGAILKGITRKSFLDMLTAKGYKTEERPVDVQELVDAHKAGQLKEVFGAGTAAVVSHVASVTHKGYLMDLPPVENRLVGNWLKAEINDIRLGLKEDIFGWLSPINQKEVAKSF